MHPHSVRKFPLSYTYEAHHERLQRVLRRCVAPEHPQFTPPFFVGLVSEESTSQLGVLAHPRLASRVIFELPWNTVNISRPTVVRLMMQSGQCFRQPFLRSIVSMVPAMVFVLCYNSSMASPQYFRTVSSRCPVASLRCLSSKDLGTLPRCQLCLLSCLHTFHHYLPVTSVMAHTYCQSTLVRRSHACFQMPCLTLYCSSFLFGKK